MYALTYFLLYNIKLIQGKNCKMKSIYCFINSLFCYRYNKKPQVPGTTGSYLIPVSQTINSIKKLQITLTCL